MSKNTIKHNGFRIENSKTSHWDLSKSIVHVVYFTETDSKFFLSFFYNLIFYQNEFVKYIKTIKGWNSVYIFQFFSLKEFLYLVYNLKKWVSLFCYDVSVLRPNNLTLIYLKQKQNKKTYSGC